MVYLYENKAINNVFKKNFLAIAIISTILTGCGGDDDGSSDGKSSGSSIVIPTPVPTPVPTPKPQIELPLLKMQDLKVSEPKSGASTFDFKVSLTKPAIKDVTFKYESYGISARGRLAEGHDIAGSLSDVNRNDENLDYVQLLGTGTIKKGEQSVNIPFVVMADAVHERTESFSIKITELNNAKFYKGDTDGDVEILDVDKEPVITLDDTHDSLIAEGNTVSIPVSISLLSSRGVKLYFSLSGKAADHKDYELLTSNPLEFNDNSTKEFIKIHVLKDLSSENKESLKLKLVSATEATINRNWNTKLITIASDKALNDTGVNSYYTYYGYDDISDDKESNANYGNYSAMTSYGYNDADAGRDQQQPNNQDGWAGYQLDAIDREGNVSGMDQVPACVRDNITGLLWERLSGSRGFKKHVSAFNSAQHDLAMVKIPANKPALREILNNARKDLFDDGLVWQANNYQYLWHDENTKTNGGEAGEVLVVAKLAPPVGNFKVNGMCSFPSEQHEQVLTVPAAYAKSCTAQNKAEYANHSNLCGAKNWRVPTINELINHHNYSAKVPTSVIDYPVNKTDSGEVIDHFGDNMILVNLTNKERFDSSVNNKQKEAFYFSSSTAANSPGSVWCMGALTGEVKLCKKKEAHSVILVASDITND